MKKLKMMFLAAVLAVSPVLFAQTDWNGGATDFIGDAANWDPTNLPTNSGNVGTIDSDAQWTNNGNGGSNTLTDFYLNVTGGTVSATQFGSREFNGGVQSFNGGSINFNGQFALTNGAQFSIDSNLSSVDVPSDVRVEQTSSFTVNDGTLDAGFIEMFDTGSFIMNGGTVTVTNNIGSDNFSGGGSAELNGGSLTAATLDFTHTWTLTMGGTSSGSATFTTGFSDTSNTSIDWLSGSQMSLSIAGENATSYESLWTAGDLLVDGANSGTFAENFNVSGSTLTLIPEPSSIALLGLAGVAALFIRRRR